MIDIQILKEGIGACPQNNDEVFFYYCLTNHQGEFLSGSQHTASSCVLGRNQVIQPLEDILKQMKQGERSIAKVFHNPATREFFDQFEIEIIRIGRKFERPWHLDGVEVYQQAAHLKGEGNQHIKEQKYKEAQLLYQEAVKLIQDEYGDREVELILQLRSNLSLTHLKNKEFDKCVQQASEVLSLQPGNIKLRHRRAVAQIELKDFDSARYKGLLTRNDLNKALEYDPNSQEVKDELQHLASREKALIKKEQERARKMLFGSE